MTTTITAPDDPNGPNRHGGLGTQIIEILLETHEDYSDSQHRSHSKAQRVYGQIFADLPDRLRAGLAARRDDVDVHKVGHAGYHVPVIEGVLYFPWRPPGGAKPEDVQFGGSTAREGLWRVRRETDALPLFGTSGMAQDNESYNLVLERPTGTDLTGPLAEVLQAGDETLRVVIVAMTSTSHQVDRIEWGDAVLGADGKLVWEPELLWDGTAGPGPASTNTASFDSGPPPRPPVSPRKPPKEGETSAGTNSDA